MKRKTQYVAAIAAFAMLAQTVSAATVSIDSIGLDANTVTVTGSAEAANEYVSMIVRNRETDMLMTVLQKKTDDDKKYEITFGMPSEFKGSHTDGEYEVTVNLSKSGGDKATSSFSFVREEIRSELLETIKTRAAGEAVTLLASDEVYQKAFEVEGIFGTRFAALDSDVQEKILISAIDGKDMTAIDYKDISEEINLLVAFYEINDDVNTGENLSFINPVFEGKGYAELEEKERKYILGVVKANAPYEDYRAFVEKCKDFLILCKLNSARYSQLDEIMSTYKTEIGLENNSEYSKYLLLSAVKKQKAQEEIVKELETNVYNFEDYIDIFETATKNASETSNSSSSGGSSGGGGSSSVKNTYVDVEIPTNTVLYADIEESFSDLDSVSWAKDAILGLSKKGIVSGRGNGIFDPNGLVTREEFVKMVVCAAEIYDSEAKSEFADVVKGSWYEAYVASAVNKGIIKGQSETEFGVGKPITRQDACVVAAPLLTGDFDGELLFADNEDISDYAKESVRKLTSAGVVSGMDNNCFMPKATCTRAQAAKIIWGILERR